MNTQTILDIDGDEIELLDIEHDGDTVILHHTADLGPDDDASRLTCMVMSTRLFERLSTAIIQDRMPMLVDRSR